MKLEWGPRFTEAEKHQSIAAFCSCYLTGYATFILVLFSSLSLPVSYITMSMIDNFQSSYVSTNGEM
jgi:hypothetical protein